MTSKTFEDRLLIELREVVAARPAPASGPVVARRSPRLPRLLIGGAATAAAIVTAVLAASGGDPAAPAYAVERQADGSVTVKINSLRDAEGLERQLRSVGIASVVDFTPTGKTCRQPRGRTVPGLHTFAMRVGPNGSATFTIPRDDVHPGRTLVITGSFGDGPTTMGTQTVEGPVAPCELVDAPAPPASPAGPSTGPEQSHSTSGDQNGPSTHVGP
jgi:hypothetical protein